MVTSLLQEPLLEFGSGQHVDIRFGLMNFGPQDIEQVRRPDKIKVGIVGTSQSIECSSSWLEKCAGKIVRKDSKKLNLFPDFPGFDEDTCFRSKVVLDSSLTHRVLAKDFTPVDGWDYEHRIRHAAEYFADCIDQLAEKSPDVILLSMPTELVALLAHAEETRVPDNKRLKLEFHDLVKGLSMKAGKPIQLIRPSTYDETKRRLEKDERSKAGALQDEATRAWNFHTALYYKAGGFPYRVPRPETSYPTCFIGITFYVTPDKSKVHTSVANVFNERGHGLAVKGKEAIVSKDDRQPHLSKQDAFDLVGDCLKAYRAEHRTMPARVVIHKSSAYSNDEKEGFIRGLEEGNIDLIDLLSMRKGTTRLFREGYYPPLRGTWLHIDEGHHILYTRGAVDFYQEYPGMYIPRTFEIQAAESTTSPVELMEELLILSKTNWNNVQMDSTMPITIGAARRVGDILRWLPDTVLPQKSYRFFM